MAQNSPFSFHCMICFEEFNLSNRYPVVLPCGHTYVCCECSQRLDKCMECRTPLYYNVPDGGNSSEPVNSRYSGTRSGWSNGGRSRMGTDNTNAPSGRKIKKRLPLPKNVVLLSLIEATALASRHEDWGKLSDPPRDEPEDKHSIPHIRNLGSMIDDDEDEEDEVDEEQKIKMGTSLAAGAAGTYAVAEKEGLEIFPSRPAMQDHSITLADEDIDNLLRLSDSKDGHIGVENPARLSYGDRVQIVSVDNGWAKLARGYGFVKADHQQLVKVGNSLDRACKLEAILRTLANRKKELRLEQCDIDNQFIRMLNSLQGSLQNDEDLTVIVADTFVVEESSEIEVPLSLVNAEPDRPREAFIPERDEIDRQKALLHERPSTPPFNHARLGCFAGPIFGSMDEGETTLTGRAALPDIPTSSLLDFMPHQTSEFVGSILPVPSHPSPSAMRAGAQAWRERQGQAARVGASTATINFRTGMSGHMGLLGNHARHPHEYLDDQLSMPTPNQVSTNVVPQQQILQPRVQQPQGSPLTYSPYSYSNYGGSTQSTGRFRMSSHTGLTTARSKPAPSHGILGSFTPLMLRSSATGSPRAEESRDQLPQAGSY